MFSIVDVMLAFGVAFHRDASAQKAVLPLKQLKRISFLLERKLSPDLASTALPISASSDVGPSLLPPLTGG